MLCTYCGTELTEQGDGNYLCPNCGILKEQREIEDEEKPRSYVG